jgi:hypothetical protein
MRCRRWLVLVILAGLLAPGCSGSSRIKARGRIVQGGTPFQTHEGEGLRMFFVPLEASTTTYESYAAILDKGGGTFHVVGKDGQGLPPGKYRVNLMLMKNKEDLFNNRLMGVDCPLTCEVPSPSGDLVVDLDQVKDLLAKK